MIMDKITGQFFDYTTDFSNREIIPQIQQTTAEIKKTVDGYILKQLISLDIDPDILKNQLLEIHRLNSVVFDFQNKLQKGELVEVVRCKDCKFADPYMTYDGMEMCVCEHHSVSELEPCDFCSYGERRTDV